MLSTTSLTLSSTLKPSKTIRFTSAPTTRSITDYYEMGAVIGHGKSSIVRVARGRDGGRVAVKCIEKHEVLRERRLLCEFVVFCCVFFLLRGVGGEERVIKHNTR